MSTRNGLRTGQLAATLAIGLVAVVVAGNDATAQLLPSSTVVLSHGEPDPARDLIGDPEFVCHLGEAFTAGDFNRDGFLDLVIGVPLKNVDGMSNAGWAHVLYGGATGVDASFEQVWDQSGDVAGALESHDRTATAVAAGDFDGDGFSDLALGNPGEAIGSLDQAGGVNVLYGSATGLVTAGNQGWSQDSSGVLGGSEADDQFGLALAAGDFDNDGRDDLAIGVPLEDLSGLDNAGAVNVLYGDPTSGLVSAGNQFVDRTAPGMGGALQHEQFGRALAVGDFDADGHDDLAVGVPADRRVSLYAGAVHIVPGSAGGLDPAAAVNWSLFSPGVDGGAVIVGGLGSSLAVGDFDGDGVDDLAAGVARVGQSSADTSGGVLVLYGSDPGGLQGARSWLMIQGEDGLEGVAEENGFGDSLAAGDIDGDGADDLLIGVPEQALSADHAGAVHVVYGRLGTGLDGARDRILGRSDLAGAGQPALNDNFGTAVLLADLNGDRVADAVVGTFGRMVGGVADAGDVVVIPADPEIFSDGFEFGSAFFWSAEVP